MESLDSGLCGPSVGCKPIGSFKGDTTGLGIGETGNFGQAKTRGR